MSARNRQGVGDLEFDEMQLSLDLLADIKAAALDHYSDLRSAHLSEVLAAGFGYATNAALRSALKNGEIEVNFAPSLAQERAHQFGAYDLPIEFPFGSCRLFQAISPETVRMILRKVEAWQEARDRIWENVGERFDDGSRVYSPGDDDVRQAIAEEEGNPRNLDLIETVRALSREQLRELTAVMLIGRGDADDEDATVEQCWDYAFRYAMPSYEHDRNVFYLIEKKPLARYLRAGLARCQPAAA